MNFDKWMGEFKKTTEWLSDSFHWDDMAKKAFEAGKAQGRAEGMIESARIADKVLYGLRPKTIAGVSLVDRELLHDACIAILAAIPLSSPPPDTAPAGVCECRLTAKDGYCLAQEPSECSKSIPTEGGNFACEREL